MAVRMCTGGTVCRDAMESLPHERSECSGYGKERRDNISFAK